MITTLGNLPPIGWTSPEGIINQYVCDPSGMLPTFACPNVVNEVFLQGSQPLQPDTLYQAFLVNQETGFLATIFTPDELVKKNIFLNVSPEARDWAISAGFPLPPTEYDTILQPPPLVNTSLESPALFADLRGKVQIHGTAAGLDFSSYRLDYGVGLNPQSWIQIGEDISYPVEEGLLASWDTSTINGLLALRLMVVHKDQSVEWAVTQVLVDNIAPEISVSSPGDEQQVSLAKEPGVVIQTQVNDSNLSNLKMYIDGLLIGEFSSGPFNMLWPARLGSHSLRIVALDRAGNESEKTIQFAVIK
jgi:hypothetical protein